MKTNHRDSLSRIESQIDSIEQRHLSNAAIRELCSPCMRQLFARRDLADPMKTSIQPLARLTVEPGYRFCAACSDVLGATHADQINYQGDQ